MRSAFRALLSSTVLVAALAACGGGGGGTSGGVFTPPLSTPPPPAAKFTLTARCNGCQNPGTKTSAHFRNVLDVASPSPSPSPTPVPVLNTGSIPQFVLFSTPDIYTCTQPAAPPQCTAPISKYGFTLFAYLDTSNGSAAPSPLPTVTWTKFGPTLSDSVVADPTTIQGVPANTLKPGFFINGPSTPGQSIYQASAIGQFAPFYVNTYYALGLSSDANDPRGYNNCLKFDAQGTARQVTTGCDLSIDSSGIHVGLGGVFLATTQMPVQVDTAGYAATYTTLPLAKASMDQLEGNGSKITFLFKLADGRYVKLYLQSFAYTATGPGTEQIEVAFAPYRVSDTAGHFDF